MSTLFFSVDVETSGPTPAVGDLLTFGAVPVREDGTVLREHPFHVRLDHGRPVLWEADCERWWKSEATSDEAKRIAFGEYRKEDGLRGVPRVAATYLHGWVSTWLSEEGCGNAAFVAHPAAFDWMWICDLLWSHLGRNVFGYRALCLRSMGFGLSTRSWGEDRTDDPDLHVSSQHPHHALYDALAQAEQLSRMLRLRGVR